jgi:CRP-like cAMP-binding protein
MRHPNSILASLSPASLEKIKPHLRQTDLKLSSVVFETRGIIEDVYFPHSGIISLVVELKEGDMLETAMVGKDGVLGASSALDGKVSLNKAIVQGEGVASAIKADKVAQFAKADDHFHSLLIRHEQVLFASAQQSAACNASHLVEARLCRWLLRMRDLLNDDLHLTQEFLGQMLGVRRSSVSLVAGTLQSAGLIKYRRGHIQILDVAGLKEASCECYEVVKGHYDLLRDAN